MGELSPAAFLPPDEQRLYDSIVHGLRSRGWSRTEAEGEAIDRVITRRAILAKQGGEGG